MRSRESAAHGHCTDRRDWKWWSIPQGPRVRSLGGLVPREHSTGGKQKLLGISKRGNSYLRKLFVQGARAVLKNRDKQCSGLKHWLAERSSRSHYNIVGVALANKLARMAWAVLASGDTYRPPVLADTTGLQMAAV